MTTLDKGNFINEEVTILKYDNNTGSWYDVETSKDQKLYKELTASKYSLF